MADARTNGYRYPAWLEVHDPDQAEVLTDPGRLRFLVPFLARARTVSAVAREMGAHPDTVLYRVRTLVGLGLLRVDREEPRRAAPSSTTAPAPTATSCRSTHRRTPTSRRTCARTGRPPSTRW